MQLVPLQAIPNQTLQVQLENQPCTLDVFQYDYGLFMSVAVIDTAIISSVLCHNRTRIVRDAYLGLSGDFFFVDTQGSADPDYTGFGDSDARFQLVYVTSTELAALES